MLPNDTEHTPEATPAESEDDLLDQVAHEFMRGMDSKDPKMVTSALRALITNIQMQDEMQDQEDMPK